MPRKPGQSRQEGTRVIHVSFEGGEDLPILFANHIFVRSTSDGLLVSFAQSHGPYIVDATPEDIERIGVPAKIICRLLIPLGRVPEIAKIFADQVKNIKIIEQGPENAS